MNEYKIQKETEKHISKIMESIHNVLSNYNFLDQEILLNKCFGTDNVIIEKVRKSEYVDFNLIQLIDIERVFNLKILNLNIYEDINEDKNDGYSYHSDDDPIVKSGIC